jgi:hypothetical protein
MFYYLYSSVGNSVDINEYLGYFEIDSNKFWSRYLEIQSNGVTLKYSKVHSADSFGRLPEGVWNEVEASKSEYGILVPITSELFEAIWSKTICNNDDLLSSR